MNINFNNEQIKGLGKVGAKIGKQIVIEGTKAVVLKGATAVITTSFDEGFDGIKDLKLDDYLKGRKEKKSKVVFDQKEETVTWKNEEFKN